MSTPLFSKITLIYPPDDYGMGRKKFTHIIDNYQPLGLAYIAAALEQAGYQVNIIDAKAESLSLESIVRRVNAIGPQIVGINASTPDFCVAALLAQKIKLAGDYTTIIGGPHVSSLPQETMQEGCFDYGVIGEGEQTIVELANAITSGDAGKISKIHGIIFRNGSGTFRTQARTYIENLDELPFPARHLLPSLDHYTYLYYKYSPTATIVTSRGCPYQCTFCDHSVFGYRIRTRSIKNIVDEIEMLVEKYNIRGLNIPDDLFTVDQKRVRTFCQELLSRKLTIGWSCFARVDTVNPEMLILMKKAGCWMISYGIESGNQEILYTIKKNVKIPTIKQTMQWTKDAGIQALGVFILGVPGENEATLKDTLNLAKRLPLYRVVFNILLPLPGSEIYRNLSAQGLIDKNVSCRYYHFYCSPGKLPYVTPGLTEKMLNHYRKKAYRNFYLRPGYLIRRIFQYREFDGLYRRIRSLLHTMKP